MMRLGLLTVTLAGCAGAGGGAGADGGAEQAGAAGARRVNVTVMYRERILVPAPAELRVWVADVSKQDVAATTVAERKVPVTSGPPYHVTLEIPAGAVVPMGRYQVRAEIMSKGRLMFGTDQGVGVLMPSEPDSAQIMVRMRQ